MLMLPDEELGVFISFNSDPGSAARNVLAAAFLDKFFPAPPTSPTPVRPDVDLADYAGEYVPLRSAHSTFERIRTLFIGVPIVAEGDRLVLGNGARLVATARDRFTALPGGAPVVFERSARGAVTHVLVGSPLATFRRARGLDVPGRVRLIMMLAFAVAAAAVLGWGYRVVRPRPESERLPSPHVRVAWTHAFLLCASLLLLPSTLQGIGFGLSLLSRTVLIVVNLNLLLGALTTVFAARQWLAGAGSVGCRCRYALVALASLANLWFAWAFHLVGAVL